MIFRIGNPDDINEIVDLIKNAIKTMESQQIFQWDNLYPAKEDFLSDIEKKTLFVAIIENKIAAIYVISEECDEAYETCQWEYNKACILHRLCVSPEFQHQGIGNQVLRHIEEQLKSTGYESIRLDVFSKNPYSLRLYDKNGYIKRGYADWRKGRFYLMEKKL